MRSRASLTTCVIRLSSSCQSTGFAATSRFLLPLLLLLVLLPPGSTFAADPDPLMVEAEATFRAELASAPNDVELLLELGSVLAQQGRVVEALTVTRKAATLEPDSIDALYALCLLSVQTGDRAGADQTLARVASLSAEVAHDLRLGMAMILGEKAQEDGGLDTPLLRQLKAAADKHPREPGMFVGIGEAYMQLERFREARAAFASAAALVPDDPQVLYQQGRVAACLGDFQEARKHLGDLRRLPRKDLTAESMIKMLDEEISRRERGTTGSDTAPLPEPSAAPATGTPGPDDQ